MDGLLLPANAAHLEVQSCHGWVTAIKAAWCAAMRGLLKSEELVLDSGPIRAALLELLHQLQPRRQQLGVFLAHLIPETAPELRIFTHLPTKTRMPSGLNGSQSTHVAAGNPGMCA